MPARGATPYVIRHGFGYTVFEHTENGIASELWVYVAMDAPVKFSVLKLRNVSGRPRRVSVTGYWEWVLGDLRQKSLLHVQTEVDLKTGALLARNYYNTEFPDRIVFLDVNDATRTLTGDRKEFIGRNGSLSQPAALKRARLSGKVGAGLDPCGAVQVAFDLPDGQERETSFRLGVGRNPADVQNLIQRFRRADASRVALEGVWAYWNRTLGAVNVDTPDPAVNVMANGWLLVSDLELPALGPDGVLSIRRRLRVPRPVAGRDGAGACRTGPDPRASAPRRRAPIPRRRRAALVASAVRARRADAFFRRLPVAALRDLPLRFVRRGHRRARRKDSLPRRPARSSRRRRLTMICPIAPKSRPRFTSIACAPSSAD